MQTAEWPQLVSTVVTLADQHTAQSPAPSSPSGGAGVAIAATGSGARSACRRRHVSENRADLPHQLTTRSRLTRR
jgi:hypothetical protein